MIFIRQALVNEKETFWTLTEMFCSIVLRILWLFQCRLQLATRPSCFFRGGPWCCAYHNQFTNEADKSNFWPEAAQTRYNNNNHNNESGKLRSRSQQKKEEIAVFLLSETISASARLGRHLKITCLWPSTEGYF